MLVEESQQACLQLAQSHYENFPVVGWWLPAKQRQAIAAIYAFARTADDWADEGDFPAEVRLAALADLENIVTQLGSEEYFQESATFFPYGTALGRAIKDFELPLQPFYDLLSAFRQDVTPSYYATTESLLDYCRRSANPVGRLLLMIFQQATPENLQDSDSFCTALQLINFIQDLAVDLTKGRCYIPDEDLQHYEIRLEDLQKGQEPANLKALMDRQCQRAALLLQPGEALSQRLQGSSRWLIRMMFLSGVQILKRLENRSSLYDRPTLGVWDRTVIIIETLCF